MDIVVKGIEGLTEKEVLEWVSILVQRREEAKVNQNQVVVQAMTAARTTIDTFRKANALEAKFEAKPVEPVKEEEVLPKDVPQG